MIDPTEVTRRVLVAVINSEPGTRQYLEQQHGQVWDTSQLQDDFDVLGFCAPYIVVKRKADGQRGTLTFQHSPRFYFSFQAE